MKTKAEKHAERMSGSHHTFDMGKMYKLYQKADKDAKKEGLKKAKR